MSRTNDARNEIASALARVCFRACVRASKFHTCVCVCVCLCIYNQTSKRSGPPPCVCRNCWLAVRLGSAIGGGDKQVQYA